MPVVFRHHEHNIVPADAGIVHQNGDEFTGMGSLPGIDRSLYRPGVGNIKRQKLGMAAMGFYLPFHFLRAF